MVFRFSRRFAPQNDSEKSSFLRMTVCASLFRMTVYTSLFRMTVCASFFVIAGLCFVFRHCRLDRQSPDSALLRSPIKSGMTLQGFVEVTPRCHCKASKKVHSHCHCKASQKPWQSFYFFKGFSMTNLQSLWYISISFSS